MLQLAMTLRYKHHTVQNQRNRKQGVNEKRLKQMLHVTADETRDVCLK